MLHYKHKQHRHRHSQKFFDWSAKSTFCLPISGCWQYNANGRSHNALPFYATKKMTHVTAAFSKMPFVGSKVSVHIVLKYVAYCNQQSLSRCITCRRCLQQSHAAKRLLPQLEVNLCCHVTVTQWSPI